MWLLLSLEPLENVTQALVPPGGPHGDWDGDELGQVDGGPEPRTRVPIRKPNPIWKAQNQELHAAMDTDGDGVVGLAEFLEFYTPVITIISDQAPSAFP